MSKTILHFRGLDDAIIERCNDLFSLFLAGNNRPDWSFGLLRLDTIDALAAKCFDDGMQILNLGVSAGDVLSHFVDDPGQ